MIAPNPTKADLAALALLIDGPRVEVTAAEHWERRWKQERLRVFDLSEAVVTLSVLVAALAALVGVLGWVVWNI